MKKDSFILILLAFINFVNIVDVMIIMPLGDILMKEFNINPTQFSWAVSAYTTSAGITGFIGAFFIDRFDRKSAMIFSLIGFSLGTFACAYANSYMLLLVARAFTGIFGGLIGSLVLAIVSEVFQMERRGKAMGAIMAAFSIASVVGVPFSLFLTSKINWQAPFILLSVMGVLAIILCLRLPNFKAHVMSKEERPSPFNILSIIWNDKNQRLALLMGMFLVLGHFSTMPFLVPYMIRNVGFDQDQITWIYMLGGGFTAFTAPVIGRLTDRFKPLKTFRILMLVSFAVTMIVTTLQGVGIGMALAINTLFFIFASGRMIPAQTIITGAVGSAGRGSFMSIKSALQQLSAALAAVISGLIVVEQENGVLGNYWMVGVFAVIISALSLFIAPKLKVAEGN